jgi:hypothetical protein
LNVFILKINKKVPFHFYHYIHSQKNFTKSGQEIGSGLGGPDLREKVSHMHTHW